MLRGVAGIELEVAIGFHRDGAQSGMLSIAAEGVALPAPLAKEIWDYLSTLKPADALIEAAWDDAEQIDDGHEADDSNPPEHVSGPVGRVLGGISADAKGKVA